MTELDNHYHPPDAPPTDVHPETPFFRVRVIPALAFGLSGLIFLVGLMVHAGIMAWVLVRYGRRSLDVLPRSMVLMMPTTENLVRFAVMVAAAGFALLASSAWMKGRWLRAVGMSITSCLLMALTAMIAPE